MERYDCLIAGGCSFTHGYRLPDNEKESWPAVLANKLDIPCINLGLPGAGNTYIANSVMDYLLTNRFENPLIVIGWSQWSRQEFCDNQGNLHHITVQMRITSKIAEMVFSEYNYPPYLYKKYLNTVLFMQAWLRDSNIDYVMFDALSEMHSGDYLADPINRALSKKIDRKKFLGFESKNFNDWTDTADRLPDGHPNAKAHRRMAEILHEALLNMNHKEQ